jgi:galactose mutarotase-like enzyme
MGTSGSGSPRDVLAARLIELTDGKSRALLYPERGFQLFSYEVDLAGQKVETIYVPPPGREPADRRYGNPVLFPAVGVSSGSRADGWDHKGTFLPMPMHGWARNVYWQVEQLDAKSLTAVVVPHPGFRLGFPFDFELQMTYRLEPSRLVLETVLKNLGSEAFPYALGFHPYLRAPLGRGGDRARCLVRAPAGERLKTPDGWKSITRAREEARTIPVTAEELPGSVVLAETGATALEVEDPASGLAARVSVAESEQSFPTWVVWSAAPDAAYVCLEPWTDAPNALNRGGTRQLAAGGTHRYHLELSARVLR